MGAHGVKPAEALETGRGLSILGGVNRVAPETGREGQEEERLSWPWWRPGSSCKEAGDNGQESNSAKQRHPAEPCRSSLSDSQVCSPGHSMHSGLLHKDRKESQTQLLLLAGVKERKSIQRDSG